MLPGIMLTQGKFVKSDLIKAVLSARRGKMFQIETKVLIYWYIVVIYICKQKEIKNMTTKEIKELALQILNRNGETGIKKSDFTVKQAKQLIKEYNLGWMK